MTAHQAMRPGWADPGSVALPCEPAGQVPPVDTVAGAIAHWARLHPGKVVFQDAEQAVTWLQLQRTVAAFGQALGALGVRPQHRVGLVVPQGMEAAALVLGLCCHCLLVPLNPALKPSELALAAQETALDVLVLPASLRERLELAGPKDLPVFVAELDSPAGRVRLRPVDPARQRPRRLSPAGPAGAMLLLRSSGTTGTPKLVPVTHSNMLVMAGRMASAEWFRIGPDDRAPVTLPLVYAGGLKNLLLVPVLLGATVVFPPAGQAFQLAAWLHRLRPTFLCTTPATLRDMVERLPAAGLGPSSLRMVMCGASYLPQELGEQAQRVLGVPVVEFYGLSEAGAVAANPLPPGRARPGSVGRPLDDALAVVDSQGHRLPPGETGEIEVRGPGVCPGYLLPDGAVSDDVREGALRTGDLGVIDPDGYLRIVGRAKEVINRGGEKVFPYEVERALLAHPDVLEAVVYGVPHPRLGQSVAAMVVPRPGATLSAQDLASWLGRQLAPYKLPRRLRLVPELPRGATGKLQRSALAAHDVPAAAAGATSGGLLHDQLLELWRHKLQRDDVGLDDDFLDRDGDSLLATDLLLEVEQLTGVSSEGWDLSSLTVRGVAQAVLAHAWPGEGADIAPSALVAQVREGSGGPPLFFCHGDIAGRGIYAHRLAQALDAPNPVWLLNYAPAHAGLDIEAVAAAYADEVARIALAGSTRSVVLGGWCNGALVAWHLAHLLRARGVGVDGLLLVEAPSLNGRGITRWAARGLRVAAALVPGRAGRFLRDEAMRGVWALRRQGLKRFAVNALHRVRVGAKGLYPDTPDALLNRSVLYYQRIARYVPVALDVPLTCFMADQGWSFNADPRRWQSLVPSVRQRSVPGTHYSAVVTHRASLAAQMAQALADLSVPEVAQARSDTTAAPDRGPCPTQAAARLSAKT